jgi:branched-chain amino acid transport system permease protein
MTASSLSRRLPSSPQLRVRTSWIVPLLLLAGCVFVVIKSAQSSLFAQQTISGLANGGIYASLAVALVLIYRATEVINFAQGAIATFTTFVAWQLIQWGIPYWPAFVLTIAIAFVGGMLLELVAIRPVERRGNVLTVVIASIGLLILIEGAVGWIWKPNVRFMPSPFPLRIYHVRGVAFSLQDLGTIGVSIAAVTVLWLFFRFTKLGLAMRAAAVRPAAARLVGIRVSWLLSLGWGLAAVLARSPECSPRRIRASSFSRR